MSNSTASSLRRPPQITLALDDQKRVLHVNRALAGTGFPEFTEETGATFHDLIHPDCDNNCRFNVLLKKAWKTLQAHRESVEWEIRDPVRNGDFRLNLSRPPTSKSVAVDRRRQFALLTVTDITEIRREYESVLSSNKDLQRRIELLESAASNDPERPAPTARNVANDALVAAQERERARIAADLHDGVTQSLGVLKFGIESRIANLQSRHPDVDLSVFEPVVDQVREAIEELRKVSRNLSPAMLSEFGICTAIDMLCNEFGAELPNVEVICAACINEIALPESVKVAIYRVVQEALNNIGKHANPCNIRVALLAEEAGLSLEISDDGAGFDSESVPEPETRRGIGLSSMRERVECTGGSFSLRSGRNQGTTIRATWPESIIRLLRDQPVLDSE